MPRFQPYYNIDWRVRQEEFENAQGRLPLNLLHGIICPLAWFMFDYCYPHLSIEGIGQLQLWLMMVNICLWAHVWESFDVTAGSPVPSLPVLVR